MLEYTSVKCECIGGPTRVRAPYKYVYLRVGPACV